jgi:hypothetical protein
MTPEERRAGLGATDIADWITQRYRSRLQIVLEKRGEIPEPDETDAMRRGTWMEEPISRWYAATTGEDVLGMRPIRHPEHPYLWASPDRVRWDGRIVEIKSHVPWMRDQYGEPGTDEVPERTLWQVQWQMHLHKLDDPGAAQDCADVCACFGEEPLIWTVPYDREMGAYAERVGVEAWALIQSGELPEVSGHQSDTEYLAKRWSRSEDRIVVATDVVRADVEALAKARHDLKIAEDAVATAENRVKAYMESADVLDAGDLGRITWRSTKDSTRRRVDPERLERLYPEVAADVIEETVVPGTRRFVVPRSW